MGRVTPFQVGKVAHSFVDLMGWKSKTYTEAFIEFEE
jgi:hypothetical protein